MLLSSLLLLLGSKQADDDGIKPPISFSIGNVRRSPYRFKITNIGWNDVRGTDSVVIEAFERGKRLQRLAWDAPPTVYEASARRQSRSEDILITASYSGTGSNYHSFTGVWLFSRTTKRLKLLSDGLHDGDSSHLSQGVIREEDASRWILSVPRSKAYDGRFQRTWKYDRKTQLLIHGPWRRGTLGL